MNDDLQKQPARQFTRGARPGAEFVLRICEN